ncbi:UDP-N-acetylglucosamine 2-epimerase [Mariniflexile jejuense]|uniref:UDP-N-acetylglucosamine 2-epimerase n=1 Tax=Mariniflexile jejuense TaxID=1173582 RepID=UPI0036D3E76A
MINIKKKLKHIILNFLFRSHTLLFGYSSKSVFENLKSLKSLFALNKTHLNFIITSKAEIRVFTPLIKYLANNSKFKINIVFIKNNSLNTEFSSDIFKVKGISFTFSTLPLVFSLNRANHLNLICLDFLKEKAHTLGSSIIMYLNKKNSKTICFQHGGSQKDNILGQSTSASYYQVVYGKYIYDSMLNLGVDEKRLFLTGNSLHDDIVNIDVAAIKSKLKNDGFDINKKIILIATCLFFEYDDRENPNELYKLYIKTIYENIDFDDFSLIVKMHPNDKMHPNLYLDNEYGIEKSNNFKVILPNDNMFTFYELAMVSDLIISRSSTTIEEGIMLGKRVVAFDLFSDGPSCHLEHLMKFSNYKKVLLTDKKSLNDTITELINIDVCDLSIIEAVDMFTYKLDGKSIERIKNALLVILELNNRNYRKYVN